MIPETSQITKNANNSKQLSAYLAWVEQLLEVLQGRQYALPLFFAAVIEAALHILLMPLID